MFKQVSFLFIMNDCIRKFGNRLIRRKHRLSLNFVEIRLQEMGNLHWKETHMKMEVKFEFWRFNIQEVGYLPLILFNFVIFHGVSVVTRTNII